MVHIFRESISPKANVIAQLMFELESAVHRFNQYIKKTHPQAYCLSKKLLSWYSAKIRKRRLTYLMVTLISLALSVESYIDIISIRNRPRLHRTNISKSIKDLWRCPWCNGYRRRKWTRWHEFKSWTRLTAFHIAQKGMNLIILPPAMGK